eukprot:7145231-Pyramimonas_sp.AAC.1
MHAHFPRAPVLRTRMAPRMARRSLRRARRPSRASTSRLQRPPIAMDSVLAVVPFEKVGRGFCGWRS